MRLLYIRYIRPFYFPMHVRAKIHTLGCFEYWLIILLYNPEDLGSQKIRPDLFKLGCSVSYAKYRFLMGLKSIARTYVIMPTCE